MNEDDLPHHFALIKAGPDMGYVVVPDTIKVKKKARIFWIIDPDLPDVKFIGYDDDCFYPSDSSAEVYFSGVRRLNEQMVIATFKCDTEKKDFKYNLTVFNGALKHLIDPVIQNDPTGPPTTD